MYTTFKEPTFLIKLFKKLIRYFILFFQNHGFNNNFYTEKHIFLKKILISILDFITHKNINSNFFNLYSHNIIKF